MIYYDSKCIMLTQIVVLKYKYSRVNLEGTRINVKTDGLTEDVCSFLQFVLFLHFLHYLQYTES